MASECLCERVRYNIYITSRGIEEYLVVCGFGAALVLSRLRLCENKAVNQANVHFFWAPATAVHVATRQAGSKKKKKEKKMQRKHHSQHVWLFTPESKSRGRRKLRQGRSE